MSLAAIESTEPLPAEPSQLVKDIFAVLVPPHVIAMRDRCAAAAEKAGASRAVIEAIRAVGIGG